MVGIILTVGLLVLALTSETKELRTRRLAIVGIVILIGLCLRLMQ